MPNFDGTGPNGSGAMTGKRRGSCSGNNMGGGNFGGRGAGRGQGIGGNINLSLEEEELILKNRLKTIEESKKNESK